MNSQTHGEPIDELVLSKSGNRSEKHEPEPGIALCLSGGGYRAMLFHAGALWRLNSVGYLPRLNRVSSVSGGSITAGVLALAWGSMQFDTDGVAPDFEAKVVAPLRALAGRTIDKSSVLRGLLTPRQTVGERVRRAYREHLFHDATLQDLPPDVSGPRFVFNATNLQSTNLWRFSRPYAWDYRVGKIRDPTIPLAAVVAASSAFPPFLSPVTLELESSDFEAESGTGLGKPPFTTQPVLSDGGVYDNLGLETAWKRYQTVLVSDGGGKTEPQAKVARDWARQSYRVMTVIDNQVRSLRKRALISSYKEGHRKGAYWGIRTNIANYGLDSALECPYDETDKLARTATRLATLSQQRQQRLINWGFAACDAALRTHVEIALAPPEGFPYPSARVG